MSRQAYKELLSIIARPCEVYRGVLIGLVGLTISWYEDNHKSPRGNKFPTKYKNTITLTKRPDSKGRVFVGLWDKMRSKEIDGRCETM